MKKLLILALLSLNLAAMDMVKKQAMALFDTTTDTLCNQLKNLESMDASLVTQCAALDGLGAENREILISKLMKDARLPLITLATLKSTEGGRFSPDGSCLLVDTADGLDIVSATTGTRLKTLAQTSRHRARWSNSGKYIAYFQAYDTTCDAMSILSGATHKKVFEATVLHFGGKVLFTCDDSRAIAWGIKTNDDIVGIIDTSNGSVLFSSTLPHDYHCNMPQDPRSKYIPLCISNRVLHLHDAKTGQPVKEFPCDLVSAFNPDGTALAINGPDQKVRIYDTDTFEQKACVAALPVRMELRLFPQTILKNEPFYSVVTDYHDRIIAQFQHNEDPDSDSDEELDDVEKKALVRHEYPSLDGNHALICEFFDDNGTQKTRVKVATIGKSDEQKVVTLSKKAPMIHYTNNPLLVAVANESDVKGFLDVQNKRFLPIKVGLTRDTFKLKPIKEVSSDGKLQILDEDSGQLILAQLPFIDSRTTLIAEYVAYQTLGNNEKSSKPLCLQALKILAASKSSYFKAVAQKMSDAQSKP